MNWYKITYPKGVESVKTMKNIQDRFYQIIFALDIHKLNPERASLFQNRYSEDNYILYFSPTSDEAILSFIKEFSVEICSEPKPKTVSFLCGDNKFWSRLL